EAPSNATDRSTPGVLNTDLCVPCGGFAVAWCDNVVGYNGRRSVRCDELIDPVILHNRELRQTAASNGLVM
ncbi:MAG: hypothetical protein ACREJN_16965, partial [Nitrospiraceae bacterium]